MTVVNCTIADNSRGGINNAGTATLDNTIVALNTNGGTAADDISGSVSTSSGYNLIGTGGSGGLVNGVNGNQVGVANPGLGALAEYGGPTQTIALLPGSPAIDAGSNALAVDASGNPLTTDQRGAGYPRVVNGTVDIGAFESHGFTLTPVTGSTPQGTPVNSPFADPLAVIVTANNPAEPVAGGIVTFSAPASGASAGLSTAGPVTIASNGQASVTATANAIGGQYTVTASTAGAAVPVSFVLNNQFLSQTITFGPLAGQTYGVAPMTLSATDTSNLPVSFTVLSGPATISGSVLTVTGAGTVEVEASQSGNASYAAANPVDESFTVAPAPLTITPTAGQSMVYGSTVPPLTYTYAGLVNGDTSATFSGGLATTATSSSSVGGYSITQGTLAATGNYTIATFNPGTLTVNPAPLTVTANAASRLYGGTDPTFAATISGFVLGQTLATSGVKGSASLKSNDTAASAVGSYTITPTVGTLSATNYTFTTFKTGALSITPAPLTVTANAASRLYGAADPTFAATISGLVLGQTLATSGVKGSASLKSNDTAASAIGSYTITPTVGTLTATNYAFTTFKTGTLSITPAPLTVTANAASRLYGAADPTFAATISGFVLGQTLATSGVKGSASLKSKDTATSAVGSYTITPTIGTLSAANYAFTTFKTGTLSVTPAPLTVTANAASRLYGAADPTFAATISGFVLGQTLATSGVKGSASLKSNDTAASAVGSYTITPAVGTLTATNYAFTTFKTGTLSIAPAPLTVTANAASRLYGAANPAFAATFSGFVLGQTLATSGVKGSASLKSNDTAASAVGSYTITPTVGTLTATNYAFSTFKTGTLSVTPAPLTVTANAASRLYGSADPTYAATISGFVLGQTLATSGAKGSASLKSNDTAASAVGSYTITPTVGTLTATNYAFTTFKTGALSITPAPLTVTANAASRLYGAADPAFAATISGFVLGQTLATSGVKGSASLKSNDTAASEVGSYTITPTVGTLTATNYAFTTFKAGTLSITPAPLTVTANAASRLYGAADPAFAATISGFVLGQTLATSGVKGSASLKSNDTATSAVGSYTITPTVGTLSATDYAFTTFKTGTLSVTPAPLTVTANTASRLYGGADPTFTATISGFVLGQTLATSGVKGSASLKSNDTATSAAGGYTITPTVGTLSATDYAFTTFKTGTLSVKPAPLTVTANTASRLYGGADPTFTATISGFVLGQTLVTSGVKGSASLKSNDTASSPVASYTITPTVGTLTATDYAFTTFKTGTLSVAPAPLTVTANPALRLYGGADPTFTATISGFILGQTLATSGVKGSASLKSNDTATSAVGSYTITPTVGTLTATDYAFTTFKSGTLSVTPAPLTVTANTASRLYGGADPTFTATISGFVFGQTLATSGVKGSASLKSNDTATSAVGSYTITPTVGTLTATDYAFTTFKAGTLSITPAPLTVTANTASRLYGGADPTFTATISGFVLGQTLATSGVKGSASLKSNDTATSAVGSYTIAPTVGTLSATDYAFTTFKTGTLSVTPAPLTVTASNESMTRGGSVPTLTYTYTGLVNGDTSAMFIGALVTTATSSSSVGVYAITLGTLVATGNYTIGTFKVGTLTITM